MVEWPDATFVESELNSFVTRARRLIDSFDQMRRYGQSLVNLLRTAWFEYESDRAGYFAVAMIYYALVSMIPILLLLMAALGLLLRFSPIALEVQEKMLTRIETHFGAQLPLTIKQLMNTVQRDSILATVISLAGILLAASVLFKHLRLAFRAIWKHKPPLVSGSMSIAVRETILERFIASVMVLGGGGLLLIALALLLAAKRLNRLLDALALHGQTTGWFVTTISSLIITAITFALLFKFLPPIVVRWRDVWLATLLSSLACVTAGEFLSLYGFFFEKNPNAYGAIGGLLAVLLWMNVVSQVLFFGGELCKVVASGSRRPGRSGDTPAASAA
jgi:membrane protein